MIKLRRIPEIIGMKKRSTKVRVFSNQFYKVDMSNVRILELTDSSERKFYIRKGQSRGTSVRKGYG